MIYGYARCSTSEKEQDIDRQKRELKELGATAETIYFEYESGTKADRPEFNKLLNIVQQGDTIVTTEVSRLTRSTKQLCDIIQLISDKGLKLVIKGSVTIDCANGEIDPMTKFMDLIRRQRYDEAEKEMKRKRREVGQAKKRIAELDRIFKRIYEDDINGTISHERFLKLSAEYEAEQRELTEKVNAEQREVDTYEQDKSDFDSFASVIRKYVGNTGINACYRQ